MYLSQREAIILDQLLYSHTEIPISSFQSLLQVSRRTVYREITNLEASLKTLNIEIVNERNKGYKLVGHAETLNMLREENTARNQYVFSKDERQDGIITTLLVNEEPVTAEALSQQFAVSLNTIYQDIDAIEERLGANRVNRLPAQGFTLDVDEINNRNIVATTIYNNLFPSDSATYLSDLSEIGAAIDKPFFLTFISDNSLKAVVESFHQSDLNSGKKMNDNQIRPVLIQLAYALDRIQAGFSIGDIVSIETNVPSDIINLAYQITGHIADQLKINIPINERNLLVNQLEGINFKNKESIFNVNFDTQLSYKVQKFIRLVSEKTSNDFRQDKRLYKGLISHIRAALKRIENDPITSFKDTSLAPVVDQYKDLYVKVEESFKAVFSTNISHEEAAYILMHFAASYEAGPSLNYQPRLLVIVSNYGGTGKIIKERLEKQFQAIFQVDITQLSKIDQLDVGSYSMILSTAPLKNFPVEYQLISPVLADKDIDLLKDFIETYKLGHKNPLTNHFGDDNYKLTFEEMRDSILIADDLLKQFEVKDIDSKEHVEATVEAVIQSLKPLAVSDDALVSQAIIKRYKTTPIGIPKTNMSLFHSVHEDVKTPVFKVYNLSSPFYVEGMDRQMILLKRILLLLAPAPLDANVKTVLGWISQSIIENNINTDLYNTGNEETLRNLLSRLFVEAIQESGKGDD
ncbi:BglG family transcription antiterminator [Aerococcus urinaeequi]|uniref:BglG family transcription antiterminator n=1 Tax=Aerococcus urinaeequi TaxID=51665 RepID=UPI003D6B304E